MNMSTANSILFIFSVTLVCTLCVSSADETFSEQDSSPSIPKPDVTLLHVVSNIRFRYAQTEVLSRVINPANVSQEVLFNVVLPETAFITGFIMTIKEKDYKAYVKEKAEAKAEYTQAVQQGQAAAHISARDSNEFTVSINVEAESKVSFNLTYEEFLERALSSYKHEINVNPGQIVKDLSVVVNIEDAAPIINLKVPELRVSNEIAEVEPDNSLAKIDHSTPEKVSVSWKPTVEEQTELAKDGVKGQFVVKYDVDRSKTPQQILVDEGYFVHFFAQDNLPPLNKHVVFVLDISGSMHGRKLQQLKDAMDKILSDLSEKDYFSIVVFSETANAWAPNKTVVLGYTFFTPEKPDMELTSEYVVAATPKNIDAAKVFIQELTDLGATNIMAGLRMGLKLTKMGDDLLRESKDHPEPIIIFLTDGEPNVEVSDPNEIRQKATSLNSLRSAIFSLGFGDGADIKFLRNLSLANSGFARSIYEGADAALQLKNFFKEVASPLLSNVTFNYLPGQVDEETTKLHFDTFFSGSEMVVVGKLIKDSLKGSLIARSPTGTQEFPFGDVKSIIIDHIPDSPTPVNRTFGHLERMWAYKTIRQLLDQNSVEQNDAIKKKALDLALKYSFVTPLTSMVVVKPNETTAVDAEKSKLHNQYGLGFPPSALAGGFPASPAAAFAPIHLQARPGGLAGPGFQAPLGLMGQRSPGLLAMDKGSGAFAGQSFAGSPGLTTSASRPYPTTTMKVHGTSGTPLIVGGSSPSHPPPDEYEAAVDPQVMETEVPVSSNLMNYTEVAWLTEQLPTNETILHPPANVSTELISLNATNVAHQSCAVDGKSGECRHFIFCVLSEFAENPDDFLPYKCVIEPNFLGVCCPMSVTHETT